VRIRLIAVGRVKDRPLRDAIDEYLVRVRRYVACDEVELTDAPHAKLEPAFVKATVEATSIALEVNGRALDSEGFARGLARASERNKGIVAFLLGGADGLPPRISSAAHDRWSLSALTFPHRLARLVLAEQLYRAMTLLKGEPYGH